MIARLTLSQAAKAYRAVKKLPKAKALEFKMPKKTGWRKPFFPKSKMMPKYSPYDVAVDLGAAGLVVGGYAGYKKLTKKDKKKKEYKTTNLKTGKYDYKITSYK